MSGSVFARLFVSVAQFPGQAPACGPNSRLGLSGFAPDSGEGTESEVPLDSTHRLSGSEPVR